MSPEKLLNTFISHSDAYFLSYIMFLFECKDIGDKEACHYFSSAIKEAEGSSKRKVNLIALLKGKGNNPIMGIHSKVRLFQSLNKPELFNVFLDRLLVELTTSGFFDISDMNSLREVERRALIMQFLMWGCKDVLNKHKKAFQIYLNSPHSILEVLSTPITEGVNKGIALIKSERAKFLVDFMSVQKYFDLAELSFSDESDVISSKCGEAYQCQPYFVNEVINILTDESKRKLKDTAKRSKDKFNLPCLSRKSAKMIEGKLEKIMDARSIGQSKSCSWSSGNYIEMGNNEESIVVEKSHAMFFALKDVNYYELIEASIETWPAMEGAGVFNVHKPWLSLSFFMSIVASEVEDEVVKLYKKGKIEDEWIDNLRSVLLPLKPIFVNNNIEMACSDFVYASKFCHFLFVGALLLLEGEGDIYPLLSSEYENKRDILLDDIDNFLAEWVSVYANINGDNIMDVIAKVNPVWKAKLISSLA